MNFLEKHKAFWPLLVAGLLSFIGVANLPYGYYEFLRWALSGAAVLVFVLSIRWRVLGWMAVAVPVFILWFPPFHITMDKSAWVGLDLLAGVALIIAGSVMESPQNSDS